MASGGDCGDGRWWPPGGWWWWWHGSWWRSNGDGSWWRDDGTEWWRDHGTEQHGDWTRLDIRTHYWWNPRTSETTWLGAPCPPASEKRTNLCREDMVAQMTRMGFSEHNALAALRATSYRGVEDAVARLVAETPRGCGSGDESLASPRGGGSVGASSSNIPPPQDEDAGTVTGRLVQFKLCDLPGYGAVNFSEPLQISIAHFKGHLAKHVGLDMPVHCIRIYQYRLLTWKEIEDGDELWPSEGSLAYEVMPEP